ncbi:hypothetical protein ETAA8_36770 [Anatilimnocola aggregata]|uniref:Uncharacterized protein n=1 Tax=Anatilimnocola aggregata TaxID=2528021 RepID=A0A517YEC4_9BACT|nr:hypothetical protein [Anatilimnocola aggregata]QDU28574.1 hypothetical protein ETAA8_36770 [Anatilimnocola aggregata]
MTYSLTAISTLLLMLMSLAALQAEENVTPALPFAPQVISRLSLDGKPRSLSIKQGTDLWLGYDLERATVLKAWQAPTGKPGLLKSGFVTRSAGTTAFEDKADSAWELQRGDKTVPLSIRYLGCSHRKDHIELRWELLHNAGKLNLYERVPLVAPKDERFSRELRVETLAVGEALLLPSAARKAWKLTSNPDATVATLKGTEWQRLTLP